MADDPYVQFAKLVACEQRGSVVAAAGCGKTEQIAMATKFAEGRRLILTHTHAGVDALRARLKKHGVSSERFRVDTIAGWCLRYAASFPKRSGLACAEPQDDREWNAVYEAAVQLLNSGAVKGVLAASYSGLFVDEYQDCGSSQHEVIKALATALPVCILGDPLQAIFDFKGQKPVDWNAEVLPNFGQVGELKEPWRWHNAGNKLLAEWLAKLRTTLEAGGPIDLAASPECVSWVQLPDDPRYRQGKIIGTCKSVMGGIGDEQLVVIGDPANINARAAIAKNLAVVGFSNIEPLGCQNLYVAAKKIEAAQGVKRLEAAMDFLSACMTSTERTAFLGAVKSHQDGGKRGATNFGDLIHCGIAVAEDAGDEALLALMEGFYNRDATRLYRREMFSAMRSALRIKNQRGDCDLADAIWEVQNRIRHAGRKIGKRSIGSTLLVKGLEFDHAVIIHAENMSRKDWYVALTRATTSVTVLSPTKSFQPGA